MLFPLSVLALSSLVEGYRHLHFTNADVCDPIGSTKEILIGEGALVLSLHVGNNSLTNSHLASYRSLFCRVKIKTREGYGLMAYAEDFYLRSETRNGSKDQCLDYLEFGQDDFIPLVTLEKSDKLCKDQSGYHYDEPKGQLLIWLKLGPLGPTERSHESLDVTRLSLVITPYRKVPGRSWDHKKCSRGDPARWIKTKYFCDGRVNCALDPQGSWADEAPAACSTTQAPAVTVAPTKPVQNKNSPHKPDDLATGLDLSLGTIVLVSILSLSVIACVIVLTLKQCGLLGGPVQEEDDTCQDQSLGMLELSRMPNRAPENTYVIHEGRPYPPSPRRSTGAQSQAGGSSRVTIPPASPGQGAGFHLARSPKEPVLPSPHPDEAPPPSYNEIFPPDSEPDRQTSNIDRN